MAMKTYEMYGDLEWQTEGSTKFILSVGLALYDKDTNELKDTFFSYVAPQYTGFKVTDYIKNLTGITDETIRSAPTFNQMMQHFDKFLYKSVTIPDCSVMGIYTKGSGDTHALHSNFRFYSRDYKSRLCCNPVFVDVESLYPFNDTTLSTNMHLKPFRLETEAKALGIDVSKYTLHDSLSDCKLLHDVHTKIRELSEEDFKKFYELCLIQRTRLNFNELNEEQKAYYLKNMENDESVMTLDNYKQFRIVK